MRAISHVGTTPAPIATEAPSAKVAGNTANRRVMRAAWTLHRTRGGSFSDALKEAWRHEKARASLEAATVIQGEIARAAYLGGSITEMKSAFPIEDYYLYVRRTRNTIAALVDRLIEILDAIDGDPDFEDDRSDFECDARHLAQTPDPQVKTVQIARS